MLPILKITLLGFFRDRIIYALFGAALVLVMLVPAMSSFSLRQGQELSISLSLSAVSLLLMVLAILLGSVSIWGDLEHRYTAGILGLPISRQSYLLGKFTAITIFLMICCIFLTCVGLVVIVLAKSQFTSGSQLNWGTIVLAVGMNGLQNTLLAAFAFLFSTFSTSFFLPIFGSIGIYLAGSASQSVFEYIQSDAGASLSPLVQTTAQILYYMIPNFSAFDLKVQAVYGLAVDSQHLLGTLVYGLTYTTFLIILAVWVFDRRDLP